MKKIIVCLVVTSLLAMINGGCSGKKKIEHKSTYTETIAGLAPETVLLEVNGRKATKRDLEAVRSFRQAFYKFMQNDVKDSDLEKVDKTAIETFSGNFIRETLIQEAIDSYLKEHGPFSTNQMATARKVVERQYEFARKNGRMRFAAIRKQMERDGVRDCFDRNVQVETLQETFLANAFTNRYVIDSNTVARVYASVEEHNALVAATNKAIAAQMQDVARKLDNGESFESLADLYSMDDRRNPGGDIGECLERDFADEPKIYEAVKKLGVGQHTDILELDDSFQILKLIEKVPAEKSQSREEALHLARIYFRRAMTIEKYPEEQVRASLEKDRRKRLTTEIIEKGLMTVKVEFPNGDLLPRDSADFYLDRAKELREEAAAKTAGATETKSATKTEAKK